MDRDTAYDAGYMAAMNDVMAYMTEINCEQTKPEIIACIHAFA
jgi:hypothetical protein